MLGGEGGLCTGTLATRFEAPICGSVGTIGVGVVSRVEESGVMDRRRRRGAVAKVERDPPAVGRRRDRLRVR